jgi:hypothetical protein
MTFVLDISLLRRCQVMPAVAGCQKILHWFPALCDAPHRTNRFLVNFNYIRYKIVKMKTSSNCYL